MARVEATVGTTQAWYSRHGNRRRPFRQVLAHDYPNTTLTFQP